MNRWSTVARRIRVPAGFAFAAVYLWLAQPGWRSLAWGVPFIVLGLLVRALAAGHLRKNQEVTTSGPYAWVRNPLYLGSLSLVTGFAVAGHSLWLAALLLVLFPLLYVPVVLAEEEWLRQRFPEFDDYAERVPRFLPRLRGDHAPWMGFSWQLYRRHREYQALLGALAVLSVLVGKVLL